MTTDRPGLRERKKQKTRETIQDHALRLYADQGYARTTVEQIAEAAEVSQSTFFRYFPTKPDTVMHDRLDPRFFTALQAQPPELTPLRAAAAAIREVLGELSAEEYELELTRTRLIAEEQELRAAAVVNVETTLPAFIEAVGRRAGREPDDPQLLMWVGAVAGATVAALYSAMWQGEDVLTRIEEVLEYLEAGLPL